MNLTQIIEKAEGEVDRKFCQQSSWEGIGLVLKEDTPDKLKSFLSEKIKEAYEAGREYGYELSRKENNHD